jgi:DNA-directed RNA polymerase specialized sigma24 family protein
MKAKQHSVSADQLVYDYGSMVSAICRRMMQDEEAAREAAQEIWLEVMKSGSNEKSAIVSGTI